MTTIDLAIQALLNNLAGNTRKSYSYDFFNETSGFLFSMSKHGVKPTDPISVITERHGVQWVQDMWKVMSKSTILRRVSAFKNLIRFCKFAYGLQVDVDQFSEMLKAAKLQPKAKSRRKVPMDKIRRVVDHILANPVPPLPDQEEMIRECRNRTFLLVLADTGLRVSEACSLKRSDIVWESSSAVITGKGSKVAVIRFSKRSLNILRTYLLERTKFDSATDRPLSSLPLFSHSTKKRCSPIGTQTGRAIVAQVCFDVLGEDYVKGEITPHSLRHYFVMVALKATGGDLKRVKELARHDAISTTELYTQIEDAELDASYREIFDKE